MGTATTVTTASAIQDTMVSIVNIRIFMLTGRTMVPAAPRPATALPLGADQTAVAMATASMTSVSASRGTLALCATSTTTEGLAQRTALGMATATSTIATVTLGSKVQHVISEIHCAHMTGLLRSASAAQAHSSQLTAIAVNHQKEHQPFWTAMASAVTQTDLMDVAFAMEMARLWIGTTNAAQCVLLKNPRDFRAGLATDHPRSASPRKCDPHLLVLQYRQTLGPAYWF
jgi:hypothetical protein